MGISYTSGTTLGPENSRKQIRKNSLCLWSLKSVAWETKQVKWVVYQLVISAMEKNELEGIGVTFNAGGRWQMGWSRKASLRK